MLINPNPTHPDEIRSNDLKLQFLELMRKNWNVYNCCKKLGINRTIVYTEWLKVDTEFKRLWDEALSKWIDGAEGNIMKQAQLSKKFIPAIFVLKAHRAETYGDKQELTVNVDNKAFMLKRADSTLGELGLPAKVEVLPEHVEKIDSGASLSE
jgi:hypothetical protein